MTIVRTTAGDIKGYEKDGIHHFKGVPFAAPPVGDLRFAPPQPPAPWEGTRDATEDGPICPQAVLPLEGPLADVISATQPQDEDCLTLTIATPSIDSSLPVMVWIHGGAFTGGSGSTPIYDGSSFARDGIVFVSINYRLHALGFLYLDELFDGAHGTGNLGILDQVRALEWVRDNIAAFGGDPGNVTIFGESAGGMSVGTLMGTPSANGLFQRAIPQSGAGSHNIRPETATRVAMRVLELLDVEPGDWAALRAVPVQRFVEVSTQLSMLESRVLLGDDLAMTMVLLPVVDGVTRDKTATELVAAGNAADVDMLIGTCAEECRLFIWAMPEAMQAIMPIPAPAQWFSATGRDDDEIRKIYSEARPHLDEREVDIAAWTDGLFTIPAARFADARARPTTRTSGTTASRGGRLRARGCSGPATGSTSPSSSIAWTSRRSSATTRRSRSRRRSTARGCASRRRATRTAATCPRGRATTRGPGRRWTSTRRSESSTTPTSR